MWLQNVSSVSINFACQEILCLIKWQSLKKFLFWDCSNTFLFIIFCIIDFKWFYFYSRWQRFSGHFRTLSYSKPIKSMTRKQLNWDQMKSGNHKHDPPSWYYHGFYILSKLEFYLFPLWPICRCFWDAFFWNWNHTFQNLNVQWIASKLT